MPLSGIWNELKKESACKKFELRGTEDIWGIYCTASDNISDPDFSQKCKGKTESELKKALRLRLTMKTSRFTATSSPSKNAGGSTRKPKSFSTSILRAQCA